MLDNEPTGADQPGTEPAGDTAATPTRRTRARKAASPEGAPAPAKRSRKAAKATISDSDGASGQSPPEGTAAGEAPPAKATRSRRRKAVEPAAEPAVEPVAEPAADGSAETGPAAQGVGGVPPALATSAGRSAGGVEPGAEPAVAGAADLDEDEDEAAEGLATGPTVEATAAGATAGTTKAGRPAAGTPAGGTTADAAGDSRLPEADQTDDLAAGTPAGGTTADAAGDAPGDSRLPEADQTDDLAAGPPATGRTRSRRGRGSRAAARAEADAAETAAAESAAEAVPAGQVPPAEEPAGRRPAAATVLFMAPEDDEAPPPTRRSRRAAKAAEAPAEPVAAPAAAAASDEAEPVETGRRRRRGRRTAEAADAEADTAAERTAAEAAEDDDDESDDAASRRRRRGRRGRGRGKGPADEAEETGEQAAAEVPAAEDDDDGDGLTRRRRRRRRKGDDDTAADDGVPTVVRIREPRRTSDEVQGVSGSTRLEAKRQRRRDGREQRRTRPPILSESEFLARREAVDRVMVVRQRADRTQIAVLEDNVLVEHYVARASSGAMAGNVYLGKVQNVLPSMEAAFVDVGRGRNAVLYAGEVNWDATGLEGRARSIEQALKSGDSVLVQVTKDPIGHKGARLTSHIALSGRHLVYVPGGNASGISRKLPDNERKRLRDVLKKLVPDGAGVIVRTAAEGASEDDLARDVKRLQAQWEDIQAKAAAGGAPVLLYEEPDLLIRVVRDLFNEDFRELVVQGDEAYDMVESYLAHVSPDLVARLHRHAGAVDVFAEKRIDEQILKGLDRKVFLPSGGHLVIDRTEAMTVVDVNTGKYTGQGGNLEETVTRNNLEAAEEIVRQLRLRDLGGIVVIDFIDMVLESNRELVLRRLTECLGRDRTKHQVTEITSLGLVQMTRKRIGAGLLEAFSETCEHCKGRGVIIHTEPVPLKASAGDKVKAVAAAPANGRQRRGRKAAAAPAEPAAVTGSDDYGDTMGYDLSRYEDSPVDPVDEVEEPEVAAFVDADVTDEPLGPLAGADDPDAADGDDDHGSSRRRGRRGGARRRTRP